MSIATVNPPQQLHFFAQFCSTILHNAQMPYPVVMLALAFVHRVKSVSTIRGLPGSEIRIFVCALMSAAKFLLDNSFSNKTWRTLSCIPLVELNATEIEFLSIMNYDLSMPTAVYDQWIGLVEEKAAEYKSLITMGAFASSPFYSFQCQKAQLHPCLRHV